MQSVLWSFFAGELHSAILLLPSSSLAAPLESLPLSAYEPKSQKALAQMLGLRAQKAKQKGDKEMSWVFAVAAAEVLPTDKHRVEEAVAAAFKMSPVSAMDIVYRTSAAFGSAKPEWFKVLSKDVSQKVKDMKSKRANTDIKLSPKERFDLSGMREMSLAEVKETEKAAASFPAPTSVTIPFATLVFQWDHIGTTDDLAQLSQKAIAEYERFSARHRGPRNNLNDDFFDYQVRAPHHGDLFTNLPSFQRAKASFRVAAAEVLRQFGMKEAAVKRRAGREIDSWATVQTAGGTHGRHAHLSATVSGVFYCSAPPGSGRLRFFDPRGEHQVFRHVFPDATPELPPFHRPFAIDVHDGLLVVFPGWLPHEVEPSGTLRKGEYRVSFAFNLEGDWHDTSRLSLNVPRYSNFTNDKAKIRDEL